MTMETEIDRPALHDHALHTLLVLALVIGLTVFLAGCAAMQAGRVDGDAGTPFAHAPTSANPVDWAGYLYVMIATLATREAAPRVVKAAMKKKVPA